MADLPRGGQPPGSASAGRAQNGGSRLGPIPVATNAPSRTAVTPPSEIMKIRRERDARKKAEQEAALLRQREQEELQLQDPGLAIPAERMPAQRPQYQDPGFQNTEDPGLAPVGRRQENIPMPTQNAATVRPRVSAAEQAQTSGQQARIPSSRYDQPGGTEEPTRTRAPRPAVQNPPSAANPPVLPPTQKPGASAQPASNRTPFPHAFERWETLSSHWEGLTSYWIRRLQENSNELSREPLNQQMSRQITDLSAAGANLFHAVVELQRLRASSERKFQRWFFEVRAEQERFKETQAELQRQLDDERQKRTEAVNSINGARAEKLKAEDMVKEMRRELQISKDEARRAWEELGRREQEERDRTTSLRNGEPTLVGGVQVVPMTQGVPSRQPTQHAAAQRPPTREGPYAGGPGPTTMGGQQPQTRRGQSQVESPVDEEEEYGYGQPSTSSGHAQAYEGSAAAPDVPYYGQQSQQTPSRGTSVPSVSPRGYSQTTSPSGHEGLYQQQGSAETSILHPTTNGASTTPAPASVSDGRSYIPSIVGSEGYGEEEYGVDSEGRRMSFQPGDDASDDEYDVQDQIAREQAYRQQYGAPTVPTTRPPASTRPPTSAYEPVSSAPQPTSQGVDYSGQGWGGPSATGWESITQRHRHPTRLSDVLEEDERSRTSPSRGSLISGERGMGR